MAAASEARILVTAQDQASRVLRGLSGEMAALGTSAGRLRGLFAGIGAGAALAGFRNITKGMEAVYEASQKVGMSVEALSALKYAAEQSGVGFEQLTGGLVKFSKAIIEAQTGNKELASLLKQIGVTAADTAETALSKVAAVFEQMPDGIEKTALATKLFGKSGADLIPFLNEGADGLARLMEEAARLGVVLNGDAAKAADDFGDNLDALKAAAEGVGIALVSDLLPSLVSVTNTLKTAIIDANGFWSALNNIGTALGSAIFENWNGIARVQQRMVATVNEIANLRAENERLNKEEWFFDDARVALIQKNSAEIAGLTARAKELSNSYVSLNQQAGQRQVIAESEAESERRLAEMHALNAKQITFQAEATKKAGGGSSADAATKSLERYQRKYQDLLQDIEGETDKINVELIQSTEQRLQAEYEAELAAWRRKLDLYKEGTAERKSLEDELADWITARTKKLAEDQKTPLQQLADEWKDATSQMQDAAVSWAENATNAFVDFVATGKASFSDLAESILRDILRIAMQKTFSPVLSGIGDALVKGLGSWLTSAHGNAFDAGRVVPFATGGIISKPVAFPLGLAGEAGPEAILPLSRMSGGDLGVKAGVGNVVVNVVEAPGKGGEVRQSTDGGQRIIEVMVERIKASIAGDVSRGLGSVPQAMERTYGLNRAAGAY
jgi:hypothetical protein